MSRNLDYLCVRQHLLPHILTYLIIGTTRNKCTHLEFRTPSIFFINLLKEKKELDELMRFEGEEVGGFFEVSFCEI